MSQRESLSEADNARHCILDSVIENNTKRLNRPVQKGLEAYCTIITEAVTCEQHSALMIESIATNVMQRDARLGIRYQHRLYEYSRDR